MQKGRRGETHPVHKFLISELGGCRSSPGAREMPEFRWPFFYFLAVETWEGYGTLLHLCLFVHKMELIIVHANSIVTRPKWVNETKVPRKVCSEPQLQKHWPVLSLQSTECWSSWRTDSIRKGQDSTMWGLGRWDILAHIQPLELENYSASDPIPGVNALSCRLIKTVCF